MARAMLIPGTCHIVHNLSNDVDTTLHGFDAWLPAAKALAHLLHHNHLRQRLVATCIKGTRFATMEPLYRRGCAKHATWRWGTLRNILQSFMYLKKSLRVVWGPQKFLSKANDLQGRESQLENEDRQAMNIGDLTKAVRSVRWWAYCEMLLCLHDVQGRAGEWAESCPCHWWLRLQWRQKCELDFEDPDQWGEVSHGASSGALRLQRCRPRS